MSLIEEALRKQREESEKSETVSPPPLPGPTSDEVQPDGQSSDTSPRRPWGLLAGIAGAGVLAILFVVWLLVFGLKLWQTQPAPTATKDATPPHAPVTPGTPAPASRTNAVAPTPPLPLAPAIVPPAPKPVPTESVSPPPSPAPQTNAAAQAIPIAEKAAPALKPSGPPPVPTKLELPVIWPRLVVSGIIGSSKNGRSAAIMNGQMLSPGEAIEGVTIEAIDKQKVKLRYGGEVKLLSVGASTE